MTAEIVGKVLQVGIDFLGAFREAVDEEPLEGEEEVGVVMDAIGALHDQVQRTEHDPVLLRLLKALIEREKPLGDQLPELVHL